MRLVEIFRNMKMQGANLKLGFKRPHKQMRFGVCMPNYKTDNRQGKEGTVRVKRLSTHESPLYQADIGLSDGSALAMQGVRQGGTPPHRDCTVQEQQG